MMDFVLAVIAQGLKWACHICSESSKVCLCQSLVMLVCHQPQCQCG